MREEKQEKVTDEVVAVKEKSKLVCARDEKAEVIALLNQTVNFIRSTAPSSPGSKCDRIMIHLARQLVETRLDKAKLKHEVQEHISTISGMTEHEKDVGMVRLASTIVPSLDDIRILGKRLKWTTEQRAYLYKERGLVFDYLVERLQEERWAESFEEACEEVLELREVYEEAARKKAEADAEATVDVPLEQVIEYTVTPDTCRGCEFFTMPFGQYTCRHGHEILIRNDPYTPVKPSCCTDDSREMVGVLECFNLILQWCDHDSPESDDDTRIAVRAILSVRDESDTPKVKTFESNGLFNILPPISASVKESKQWQDQMTRMEDDEVAELRDMMVQYGTVDMGTFDLVSNNRKRDDST